MTWIAARSNVMDAQVRPELGSNQAVVMAAVAKLIADAEAAFEGDHSVARSYLTRASTLLSHDWNGDIGQMNQPIVGFPLWRTRRIVAYVDEHLRSTIRIDDLARITGLSKSHFFRAFKATFGEPPLSYIAGRRIEQAKELMLTSDDMLCSIALTCGFCDQSHFTRVFRRVMGCSPQSWRRRAMGPDTGNPKMSVSLATAS
jgi:AraC-like DNA-binding protein